MDPYVRERLGNAWLPWFFHKDDPARAIGFDRDSWEDAVPLRVKDVVDARVQEFLDSIYVPLTVGAGSTTWRCIEAHRQRLAECDAFLLILSGWYTRYGPLLVDGCRRSCAIYLLDPRHVELDFVCVPPIPADPQVRAVEENAPLRKNAQLIP